MNRKVILKCASCKREVAVEKVTRYYCASCRELMDPETVPKPKEEEKPSWMVEALLSGLEPHFVGGCY